MASARKPITLDEAAYRQTVFRHVNENIAQLTGLAAETGYSLYICECSQEGCAESIEITPAEYEAVRTDAARFVVLPGHQMEGIERVIAGNSRFLVVEKFGEAGEIAEAEDPREA